MGSLQAGTRFLLIIQTTIIVITTLLPVQQITRAESGAYGPVTNNLRDFSSGGYITGYFTPVEGDYPRLQKKNIDVLLLMGIMSFKLIQWYKAKRNFLVLLYLAASLMFCATL
jgi:hypothetical protein